MRAPLILVVCLVGCRWAPSTPQDDSDAPVDSDLADTDTHVAPVDNDADGWEVPQDCDDDDPRVHPGADEVCNGRDDDCDELVDSLDGDILDATHWYRDADGDGLGDPGKSRDACEQVAGWVQNDEDCNDEDPSEGVCSDEIDLSITATLIGTAAGDRAGSSIVPLGDANGDGFDDLLVGATHHDPDVTDGGAAYLVFGPIPAQVHLASADVRIFGVTDNGNARPVAVGDRNGDGVPDVGLLVDMRTLSVLYGPLDGAYGADEADEVLQAAVPTLGVVGVGDFDGDGSDDLAAAYADFDPKLHRDVGYARVYQGGGPAGLSEALLSVQQTQEHGGSLSLQPTADLDGDGLDDLLLGEASASGPDYVSAVFLVNGGLGGIVPLADLGPGVLDRDGDTIGASFTAVADLTGDGHRDLLAGSGDAVYLVEGPIAGRRYVTDARATFEATLSDGTLSGASSPGDLDDDGIGEVILGSAFGEKLEHAPPVWLMSGPYGGIMDVVVLGQQLSMPSAGGSGALLLAAPGDTDGDGVGELLVASPNSADQTGEIHLLGIQIP